MSTATKDVRKSRNRRRAAQVRRHVHHRRLICEALEDRRLLSDGAQLISLSPTSGSPVVANTSFNEVVVMKNTGTSTWAGTVNGYTLNRNPQATDPFQQGSVYYTALDSAPVAPGGTGTFTMRLTAPATAGTYTETWQMSNLSQTFFGQTAPLTLTVTGPVPATAAPILVSPGSSTSPGPTLSGTSQTFQWGQVTNATSYLLQWQDLTAGTGITNQMISGGTTTSYTVSGLNAGDYYQWNMYAYAASGTSALSTTFYFGIQLPAPILVRPGSSTPPGPALTLGPQIFQWDQVTNAASYSLQLGNVTAAGVGVWQTLRFPGSATNSSNYMFIGLPGNAYAWNMYAYGVSGSSPVSSTFYFTIKAPLEPPVVSVGLTGVGFVRGGTPVTVARNLTVTDPDSTNLASATVAISGGQGDVGDEILAVPAAAIAGTNITASYNPATDVLGLSGTDTLAHYQQALQSVTYADTLANTTNWGNRTLTFQVSDASLTSASATGTVTVAPLAGDANLDGTVDIKDLTILLSHWGQTGMTWAQGDFNGDGTVDIKDLNILLSHWGETLGTRSAGPERSSNVGQVANLPDQPKSRIQRQVGNLPHAPRAPVSLTSNAGKTRSVSYAAAYDAVLQSGAWRGSADDSDDGWDGPLGGLGGNQQTY